MEQIPRANSVSDVTQVVSKAAAEQGKAQAPSWVRGPAVMEAPKEDPRLLALEFLLQMAEHFPAGAVNADCLARSLEAAVYEWAKLGASGEDDGWTINYWAKIYALVAAVCGKQEKGTLQDLI
jgi:hypothetical protein